MPHTYPVMTATPTPRELLADFVQQRRKNSAAANEPTDRALFPGLHLEPTGFIFTHNKTLMFKPLSGQTEPLDGATLARILDTADASALVADETTLKRMAYFAEEADEIRAEEAGEDDKQFNLVRRLGLIRALSRSMKLPVLTDVLAYRYWLPDGLPMEKLESWGRAFQLNAPTTVLTMRNLLPLALDGDRGSLLAYESSANSVKNVEQRMMASAMYKGVSADCTVFSQLEQFGELETGLRTMDPGLLDMHVIDGQVCRLYPVDMDGESFTATVSSPFKLKEGGIRLTDGVRQTKTNLTGLDYDGTDLIAVAELPDQKKSRGKHLVPAALYEGEKLYAMAAVFGMGGGIAKRKRWMGGDVERDRSSQVPLDVLLAGGPVESAA